jgi:hypothetical protein
MSEDGRRKKNVRNISIIELEIAVSSNQKSIYTVNVKVSCKSYRKEKSKQQCQRSTEMEC